MIANKKTSFLLSIITFVLCIAIFFPIGVMAKGIEKSDEAILLSEEEANIDKSKSRLISQTTMEIVTDEKGNLINIYQKGQPRPYSSTTFGKEYTATLNFYKSGGTYYVDLDASVDDSTWWFVKHQLQIRPKNNTNWFEHTNTYSSKPKSISDTMYFSYPNGAPSVVSVEVKGYFSVSGPGFFDKVQRWDKITFNRV